MWGWAQCLIEYLSNHWTPAYCARDVYHWGKTYDLYWYKGNKHVYDYLINTLHSNQGMTRALSYLDCLIETEMNSFKAFTSYRTTGYISGHVYSLTLVKAAYSGEDLDLSARKSPICPIPKTSYYQPVGDCTALQGSRPLHDSAVWWWRPLQRHIPQSEWPGHTPVSP